MLHDVKKNCLHSVKILPSRTFYFLRCGRVCDFLSFPLKKNLESFSKFFLIFFLFRNIEHSQQVRMLLLELQKLRGKNS